MSKSAAGKNVRAKSGLNSKSILDQGWGEFRRQLDYNRRGTAAISSLFQHKIPAGRVQSSHISAENRQTQAQFHVCNVAMKTTPMLSVRLMF